jgi:hypothetical protein
MPNGYAPLISGYPGRRRQSRTGGRSRPMPTRTATPHRTSWPSRPSWPAPTCWCCSTRCGVRPAGDPQGLVRPGAHPRLRLPAPPQVRHRPAPRHARTHVGTTAPTNGSAPASEPDQGSSTTAETEVSARTAHGRLREPVLDVLERVDREDVEEAQRSSGIHVADAVLGAAGDDTELPALTGFSMPSSITTPRPSIT